MALVTHCVFLEAVSVTLLRLDVKHVGFGCCSNYLFHKAVTIGLRLSLVLDDGVLVFPCASVRTKFKSRTQIKMVMVTVLESLAPIEDGRRR